MKLRITDNARSDLRAIGDYIAADHPARAISFVEELETRCRRLVEHPLAWPTIARFANVRRCLHKRYLILYRVEPTEIIVLHVVHGARDYETLLTGPTERER